MGSVWFEHRTPDWPTDGDGGRRPMDDAVPRWRDGHTDDSDLPKALICTLAATTAAMAESAMVAANRIPSCAIDNTDRSRACRSSDMRAFHVRMVFGVTTAVDGIAGRWSVWLPKGRPERSRDDANDHRPLVVVWPVDCHLNRQRPTPCYAMAMHFSECDALVDCCFPNRSANSRHSTMSMLAAHCRSMDRDRWAIDDPSD